MNSSFAKIDKAGLWIGWCCIAIVVGHLFRQLDRKLQQPFNGLIRGPGQLNNYFFSAIFFNRVDVGLAAFEQVRHFLHRGFVVAIFKIGTNKTFAELREYSAGLLVHVDDLPVLIANGQGGVRFLKPIRNHSISFMFGIKTPKSFVYCQKDKWEDNCISSFHKPA